MAADVETTERHVVEPRCTPALSLLLGYGAILAFLAGVRRSLSFRTEGGPTVAQIAVVLWLFVLALAALAVPSNGAAFTLPILGFLSLGVLDPWAALLLR